MEPTKDLCGETGQLQKLLRDELAPEAESQLLHHLSECADCQRSLEAAAGDDRLWSDLQGVLHSDVDGDFERFARESGEDRVSLDRFVEYLGPTDRPDMLGRLGTYEVSGLVGQGSAGIVAKAFDPSLNRYVAIKTLSPVFAASGAARQRFAREARAAAAVLHQNVIPIYTVDEYRGLPYIVMQYVAGGSLQQRIDQRGPLEPREVIRLATQVASGLAAAHAQGIVHRDVKPANIMLESNVDRALVSDFGLARVADDAAATCSGVIAGTPQFMSPEQARGDRIDRRSDLFSLGSVMYTGCTARLPFAAETVFGVIQRVCDKQPRPIREISPEVPVWLEAFISKLMAKRPEDRLQSAEEVSELLELELGHLQNPTSISIPDREWHQVPSPAPVSKPSPPRRLLPIAGAVFGLLAVLAWGVFQVLPPSADDADATQSTSTLDEELRPLPESTERDVAKLQEFRVSDGQRLSLGADKKLIIEAEQGNVHVAIGEQPEVDIRVERIVLAGSREEADQVARRHQVTYARSERLVRVGDKLVGEQERSPFREVAYRVTVPRECGLDIRAAGDIFVQGELHGDARLESTEGMVTVEGLRGRLTTRTKKAARLVDVQGQIHCSSAAGGIDARFHEPLQQPCVLRSSAGSVNVRFAKDFPLSIVADTNGGRLSSAFSTIPDYQHTLDVDLLGGGPRMEVHTRGPSITFGYLDPRPRTADAGPISGITLDGELGDWPDTLPTFQLRGRAADLFVEGDALAQFRVGYDAEQAALYVGVEVVDDEIVLEGRHGDHWSAQDSCEVFVDVIDPDWKIAKRQPTQFYFREEQGAYPHGHSQSAEVVRDVKDGRITYEWKIDLRQVGEGLAPVPGSAIRFDVAVCDRDGDTDMAMLAWGPHSDEKWHDSRRLSTLRLTQGVVSGAASSTLDN